MVKSSTALVPLVGVLMALIAFAIGDLASVEVQMPRKLDGCGPEEQIPVIRVNLHADSSAELDIDGLRSYVDAPRLSATLRASVDEHVEAIYLDPDLNTSWQQVVEAISTIANASGLKVALVTPPEPRYDQRW